MKLPDHKNIQNTLLYTQQINFDKDDNYHSTTTKTSQEAQKLVETGLSTFVLLRM
ncbi:hypothetical protein [Candidatus Bathycorpusculum sp.]|uniref:hypothetical protein n=1 Tax=Candidatus Bathycorpusculum sp. TaxID=2994959 RepID=UPI00281F9908|nr:hypothetical protein [Candidatus Termitimicrobium sp.]MCL2685415.1 hypothetical protein [Candidatus Termitimicrobium sp.]